MFLFEFYNKFAIYTVIRLHKTATKSQEIFRKEKNMRPKIVHYKYKHFQCMHKDESRREFLKRFRFLFIIPLDDKKH